MRIIKKIFKTIGILFLVVIILLLLAVAGMFIYHRVNTPKNKDFLQQKGYCNLVSVGDHALNLVRYGGEDDKHRIIALGGNGAGFPIEFRTLAGKLSEEGAVYYLARPGFDGSDDVEQDMTPEFVVEEFRTALQNAGIEAPYVLMPHSYAGILATYWVNQYPDEIEAMIDLDGLVPQSFTEEQLQEAAQEVAGTAVMRTLMNLGIGDVALHALFPVDPRFSEDEQKMYDAMTIMTYGSAAFVSELNCVAPAINRTWETMQPNDVPKLYINATNTFESREELVAADALSEYRINFLTQGFEGSDAERREKAYDLEWEEIHTYKTEHFNPYIEKLGNCKVVNLPGDHFIYQEQPDACAEIITEFLNKLG